MGNISNNQGRAYEYICLITLLTEINKIRKAEIVLNSSFYAASSSWELMTDDFKKVLSESASAAISALFELEPLIIERSEDMLFLQIQPDSEGKSGDVRDIVISRKTIKWEIGLSLKHNHFAVKHSRLAKNLDFGKRWYGISCSEKYWEEVKPIFDYLLEQKNNNMKWRDLTDKESAVYVPLLKAFSDELVRSYEYDSVVASRMVEYLLGEFDFYKVISIDARCTTYIQSFNLHGQLNHSSKELKSKFEVPIVCLPTRLVKIEFKPDSNNTLELYMDGGWQFSFRIHNASTYVETSLKFDIQIVGMPANVMTIECKWK